MGKVIKRGEIWTVDLRKVGSEISKIRPALVVSINSIQNLSPVVVVLPLSSRISQIIGPERVLLSKTDTGLIRDSVALSFQVRAIEKRKLVKRISRLSKQKMVEVEGSIKIVLGLLI